MKFAIQVNGSPYGSQSATTAYQFIKAAIEQGHSVIRVFFYHDGIYNGLSTMIPPSDERHPGNCWTELARQHGIDLVVCISAAQRRGLVEMSEDEPAPLLAQGFRIAGLGLWVEACLCADRYLQF